MAETLSQHWVLIQDEKTGLNAFFPTTPFQLTFDLPFQNTPAAGQLYLYSTSTASGLLVAGIVKSEQVEEELLKKEELRSFFENTVVPHVFFQPSVFKNQQRFEHTLKEEQGRKTATYRIFYRDGDQEKHVEGIAFIKNGALHFYLYLASEENFQQAELKQFLKGIS